MPGSPANGQAVTTGQAPARLLGMHCPPGSGFPVELAATIQDGTAPVITSQNPTRTAAAEPADPAALRTFIGGVRFQR